MQIFLSNNNGVPWKKGLVVQVATQLQLKVWRDYLWSFVWCAAEVFIHTSHFITQNIKKAYSQGLRLNKINNFYWLIKDILKWLAFLPVWWWMTEIEPFCASVLMCARVAAVLWTVSRFHPLFLSFHFFPLPKFEEGFVN